MSCIVLIKEHMDSLTRTETRLANYLLEHSAEVIRMSAKDLAAICEASPAAVVRFAQKLGFRGFPELRLDLAQSLPEEEEPDEFQGVIRDNDSIEAILRKCERVHLRNTSLTYQMVNPEVLAQAVEQICAAQHIHIFGVGASGLLALDFLYKSSRIGLPAFYHSDVHINLAAASLLGPEDTAIAISYSGETKETVLAAKAAKEHGAKVVAITRANGNTLSRLADYLLCIPGEEREFRVGAMTSRMSGLLILDLLYLCIAKHDPARTQENLRQTRDLICAFQSDSKTTARTQDDDTADI